MRVSEICTRDVIFCGREATVAQIAQLMREHHVGDLLVGQQQDGRLLPEGIVTDRDLVVRVLAGDGGPATPTAAELMSSPLIHAHEDEFVYEAIGRMQTNGIRRLPVLDSSGFLVGMLTLDDVVEFLAEELTQIARVAPRQIKFKRPT